MPRSPRRRPERDGPAAGACGAGRSASGVRNHEVVAARGDLELRATVLRPRRLVVALRDRLLLAARVDDDATRRDPTLHEIIAHGTRTTLAQGHVVLVG